jgi:hypothetical protein
VIRFPAVICVLAVIRVLAVFCVATLIRVLASRSTSRCCRGTPDRTMFHVSADHLSHFPLLAGK